MKKTAVLILALVFIFAGCKSTVEIPPETTRPEENSVKETTANVPDAEASTEAPSEAPTTEALVTEKYNRIISGSSKDKSVLDNISVFNQMDGMEAGCEAVALTAAINHFGYKLDIDDIVDDYLVYSDTDFVVGYIGDPHYFYEEAGIFPPGIITTTLKFVKEKNANFYPVDTTGRTMDELYKLIDAGCPVLVWTTYDRNDPYIEYTMTYNGIEYPWYASEHCVCLFGYDRKGGMVKVADPWSGTEDWESAEWFEHLYDEIGRFSVALIPIDDLK